MNILLINESDIIHQDEEQAHVKVTGDQYSHVSKVQKFSVGDELRLGLLNGKHGIGKIHRINNNSLIIHAELNLEPPNPAPCKLILALPRPIMLKRILVDVAMLGIKDIVLLHSHHVQKSFWSSKVFEDDGLNKLLIKGLEQSCDTVLPTITLAKQFKPFVEDQLKTFSHFNNKPSDIILAHPNANEICPQPAKRNFTLIVGPENGFTPYEIEKFQENGAKTYTLGERHLRVETAATYLLGRLL